MDVLYQGEEKAVVLTVTDTQGTPIDLTGFTRIIIYLIVSRALSIKYAYPTEPGYEVLNMDNAATGKIQFNITDEVSALYKPEQIGTYELTLETAAGEKSKALGEIFRVKEALSRNE